jgi:hypothetical protein
MPLPYSSTWKVAWTNFGMQAAWALMIHGTSLIRDLVTLFAVPSPPSLFPRGASHCTSASHASPSVLLLIVSCSLLFVVPRVDVAVIFVVVGVQQVQWWVLLVGQPPRPLSLAHG